MARHYAEGHDPITRGVVRGGVAIAAGALLALGLHGCDVVKDVDKRAYEEEYLPGQPLDAVRLTAPSFSDADYCYKVADRTSGACWWAVKIEGKWCVLPICEGHSYVEQQGGN